MQSNIPIKVQIVQVLPTNLLVCDLSTGKKFKIDPNVLIRRVDEGKFELVD